MRYIKIIGLIILGFILILFANRLHSKKSTKGLSPERIDPKSQVIYPEMVLIPAGEFIMGSDNTELLRKNEIPEHKVYLDEYYIDSFEVTNSQYDKCVQENKCGVSKFFRNAHFSKPNYPVVGISWFDSKNYCNFVGKRLPTEAEWEKAARGNNGNIYTWGNDLDLRSQEPYANIYGKKDRFIYTAPVGSYPKDRSIYQVFDLNGNVREWVEDLYEKGYYKKSHINNPKGPISGKFRLVKGSSFKDTTPTILLSYRHKLEPTQQKRFVGFRCAKSLNEN